MITIAIDIIILAIRISLKITMLKNSRIGIIELNNANVSFFIIFTPYILVNPKFILTYKIEINSKSN